MPKAQGAATAAETQENVAACEECGAALPGSGEPCGGHLNALLLLEAEALAVPGVAVGDRGRTAHFFAVSSYVLQHPRGMNYTADTLTLLRRNVAAVLAGTATLDRVLAETRRASNGAVRVLRREGDPAPPPWPVAAWPMTVADVLAGGTEGYAERVAAWAGSVIRALEDGDR